MKELAHALQKNTNSTVLVAVNVINAKAILLFEEFDVFAIRSSDNSFVGDDSIQIQTGNIGPDTGSRLFRTFTESKEENEWDWRGWCFSRQVARCVYWNGGRHSWLEMRMTENESRNNRESRLPINFSTSRSSNGGRKMYKAERPFPNGASNPTRVNRASFVNRNCQLSLVVAIHPTHSYGGRASAPPRFGQRGRCPSHSFRVGKTRSRKSGRSVASPKSVAPAV